MLSGEQAYSFMSNAYISYKSVSEMLQTNIEQVPEKLKSFIETYEDIKIKIETYNKQESGKELQRIINDTKVINNLKTYIGKINVSDSNEAKEIAVQSIKSHNLDFIFVLAKIATKTVIVGCKNSETLNNLDVSEVVSNASKLYGGGASKDKVLSIGGGPSEYDDIKCIEYVTQEFTNNI
jgi:alanyl-tRNA synthetase